MEDSVDQIHVQELQEEIQNLKVALKEAGELVEKLNQIIDDKNDALVDIEKIASRNQ